MPVDSFFASTRKRKRPTKKTSTVQKNIKNRSKKEESDIEGDSGDDDHFNANQSTASEAESSEEEIEETAAEKRVRLAKAYLNTIENSLEDDVTAFDAADLDRDLIAERLKKDDVRQYFKSMAKQLSNMYIG